MAVRITLAHTLYTLMLALWWGAFVTLGALVVPSLFAHLPTHTAADTAVALFRWQGLMGFVLLATLAAMRLLSNLRSVNYENACLAIVFLAAAALYFWLIPELLAQRFLASKEPMWHLAASALYLLQTLAVLVVLVQRLRTPTLSVPKVPKRSKLDVSETPVLTEAVLPASV
jgi:Domain of unknown function (DUF4149)